MYVTDVLLIISPHTITFPIEPVAETPNSSFSSPALVIVPIEPVAEVPVTATSIEGIAVSLPRAEVPARPLTDTLDVPDTLSFFFELDVPANFSGDISGSYTTIIAGKFFEGSTLPVSTSDGAVTDGASPASNITVTTSDTHGFSTGTKVYLRNTVGPKILKIACKNGAEALGFAQDIGDIRTELTGQIGEVGTVGALARAALESRGEQARSELQTGIFGKIEDVQSDFAGQVGELEAGIGDFERRQFERQAELQQDVTSQLGDFRADIAEYKDTLAGQNEAQEAYYAANKRFREMQIQDAERARTTQAYGSPGTTMNQQVKGVRRAGSSKPGGLVRSRSPRNVFNRSGLRISSLNI